MPDIFDAVAGGSAQAPSAPKPDIFDAVAAPKGGDIFDRVASAPPAPSAARTPPPAAPPAPSLTPSPAPTQPAGGLKLSDLITGDYAGGNAAPASPAAPVSPAASPAIGGTPATPDGKYVVMPDRFTDYFENTNPDGTKYYQRINQKTGETTAATADEYNQYRQSWQDYHQQFGHAATPGVTPTGERSILGGIAAGVQRGVGGAINAAGGAIDALTAREGWGGQVVRPLDTVSDPIKAAGTGIAASAPPSTSVEKQGAFQPTNWRWYTERGAEAVPVLLTQIGTLFATKGASAGAQFAAFSAPAVASAVGSTYNSAIERGADPRAAQGEAILNGVVALALQKVNLAPLLTNSTTKQFFQNAIMNRVGQIGAKGLAEAGSNALVSVAQEAANDTTRFVQENDPKAYDDWQKRYLGAAAQGATAGAVMGAAHAVNDRAPTENAPAENPAPAAQTHAPEAHANLIGRLAQKYPDLKGNELAALAAEMLKKVVAPQKDESNDKAKPQPAGTPLSPSAAPAAETVTSPTVTEAVKAAAASASSPVAPEQQQQQGGADAEATPRISEPKTQNADQPIQNGQTPTGTADVYRGKNAPEHLPPVESGKERFFHGGIPGDGARWVTPDYKYAEGYAEKTGGAARVQYVDIPTDHPILEGKKAFDDTGTSTKAPFTSFEAPAEIMKNAKPVLQEPANEPTSAVEDQTTPAQSVMTSQDQSKGAPNAPEEKPLPQGQGENGGQKEEVQGQVEPDSLAYQNAKAARDKASAAGDNTKASRFQKIMDKEAEKFGNAQAVENSLGTTEAPATIDPAQGASDGGSGQAESDVRGVPAQGRGRGGEPSAAQGSPRPDDGGSRQSARDERRAASIEGIKRGVAPFKGVTVHDDGTNIHLQMPDGKRVPYTLVDRISPQPHEIVDFLKSARAANDGNRWFTEKGQDYALPTDQAGWDRLSDREKGIILDTFRTHGQYNHVTDSIISTHQVAQDHTIAGEETFHALARRLKEADRDTYNRMLTKYDDEDAAFRGFLEGKSKAQYFERLRKGTAHQTPQENFGNRYLSPKDRAAAMLLSAAQDAGVLLSDHEFETFANDGGGLHPDVLDEYKLRDKNGKPRKNAEGEQMYTPEGHILKNFVNEGAFSNATDEMSPAQSDRYQQRIVNELLMTKQQKIETAAQYFASNPYAHPELKEAAEKILGKQEPQAEEKDPLPFASRRKDEEQKSPLSEGDTEAARTPLTGGQKGMFGAPDEASPLAGKQAPMFGRLGGGKTGKSELDALPQKTPLEQKLERKFRNTPTGDMFSNKQQSAGGDQGSLFATRRASEAGASKDEIEDARKQWAEKGTESPYFKKWFGDSKVVDKDGKPLVVYHGSPDARFVQQDGTFKSLKERLGMLDQDPSRAFFFSTDKRVAGTYADDHRAFDYQNAEPATLSTYLSLKNPMVIDAKGADWTGTRNATEQAKAAGHDGIIIRNVRDEYNNNKNGGRKSDVYVAFNPEQIKSATGNRGTFDSANPDIRFAVRKKASEAGANPEQVEDARKQWAEKGTDSPYFKKWFGESKTVDEQGKPKVMFHGTGRPDRIGDQFRADRATSGPMQYFTDDPDIGSAYAMGKADTSLERPADYADWFKYKPKGSRSEVNIEQAWNRLSPEERAEIGAKLPHVTSFDENNNESSTIRLGNANEYGLASKDHWDYEIRQARGNVLKAAKEIWLNSGNLVGSEGDFLDVLSKGGMKGVRLDDPNAKYSAVYPAYLSIKKPLVTTDIPQNVMDALEAASRKTRVKAAEYGADAWDKNTRDPRQWMSELKNDYAQKKNSFVWTSVPDWVTKTLREQGYDGIQDTGGKMGGQGHNVWVPFDPEQIKSATGNRGTFDENNANIKFATRRRSEAEPSEFPTDEERTSDINGRPAQTLFGPEDRPSSTGIKNATVDEERAQRGLPPAMQAARRSFGEVWDNAMREIDRNPTVQDDLIASLKEKLRALTDREDALLLHRQVDLQNQHAAVSRDLINAQNAGDQAAIVENRAKEAALSDKLLELYNINKSAGTESGRGLNARKMMAKEDFSLAAMETRKRAANGGRPLTPQESDHIKELKARLDETQKKYDEYVKQNESRARRQRANDATSKIIAEASSTKDPLPVVRAKRESILAGLRQRVATLKDSMGSSQFAVRDGEERAPGEPGKEPTSAKLSEEGVVSDWSHVPNLHRDIQELARTFVQEGVRDRDTLVDKVHGELKDILKGFTKDDTVDAISGYGKFRPLSKDEISVNLRDLKGQLQQEAKIRDMVEKGQAPLKTGVEHREPSDEERRLIQQVNDAKKKLGITTSDPETELKGALDGVKTRLKNQISDLDYQIAKGEKTVRTKSPSPSDAEVVALRAKRDTLQKQFDAMFSDPKISDEDRVKLAIASTERSLEEYERRLKDNQPFPAKGAPAPTSPELEAVRARRDAAKEELQHLRDVAGQDTKNAMRQQVIEKAIAQVERKIQAKELATPKPKPAETPEIAALNRHRDLLQKTLNRIRAEATQKPASQVEAEAQAKRIKTLESSISAISEKIANKTPAPVNQPKVESPEIEALKDHRDELLKTLRKVRSEATKKSPEEIALQGFKARTKTRIAELQEKIAKGDFAKNPPKPEVKLDPEAEKLAADKARVQQQFQMELMKDRMKNRTMAEKFQDAFVKFRRSSLLSSPVTLAKLSSAALQRTVFTPVEEVVGAGIGKAFPGLAERAPREGGFNTRAEAKALTEGFTTGMRDAWDMLRTGKSNLDVLNGKADHLPPTLLDYIGHIHGALKSEAKRNEFARSFEKRTAFAMRNGLDVTDPLVQTKIAKDAYIDASRSIFMQDNVVVKAYKSAIRTLEQPNAATGKVSPGGKALATTLKTVLPIVKVPTNIVAETMQYATGAVTGSAKLAKAYHDGIQNLPPDQADAIMRSLKKGSLGLATLALGFFGASSIGGYYQPGQKRDDKDVKAGNVRLFGHDIPSYLLHNPLLECLQIGATMRRVAESKLKKSDDGGQGITAGVLASILGVVEHVPFVSETEQVAKVLDPRTRDRSIGQTLESLAVPSASQWAAQKLDTDENGNPIQRKPHGIIDNLKMGIPMLRSQIAGPNEAEIKSMAPADAAEAYSAMSPQEKAQHGQKILDKIINSKSIPPAEQDKLMADHGITPPPDLSTLRQYRALEEKAAADQKSRQQAKELADQITELKRQGEYGKASELTRKQQEKRPTLQLVGDEAALFEKLKVYRQERTRAEKLLQQGLYTPEKLDQRLAELQSKYGGGR